MMYGVMTREAEVQKMIICKKKPLPVERGFTI